MEHPYTAILVFVGLILVNGLLYAFGAALQNLNGAQLEKKAEEGDRKARRLLKLVEQPNRFIYTLHFLAVTLNVVLGAYVLHEVHTWMDSVLDWSGPDTVLMLLTGFVLIFLLVTLGHVAARKIGANYAEGYAAHMYGMMNVLCTIFSPVTYLIGALAGIVVRLFGVDPNANEDDVTEEEIISMVNEGHEQGVIEASEAEMINNILGLGEREAQDIMTHRSNIVALSGEMTLGEAGKEMLSGNNSRYPVYAEDIDHITGILHLKDVMQYQANHPEKIHVPIQELPGLIRDAVFIPETRDSDDLFRMMQAEKIHMVIVVDEYGQTAGLVAMEDILEEIVGNIFDEYDDEEVFVEKRSENTFLMKGTTPLEEVAEALDVTFEEEEFDTLNGYLIAKLDHIPSDEDKVELSDEFATYQILSVENKVIGKVLVKKLNKPQPEEDDE